MCWNSITGYGIAWAGYFSLWHQGMEQPDYLGSHYDQHICSMTLITGKQVRLAAVYEAQPSASKPLRSTMSISLLEGPLGFFLPCSHFCTVDRLVLR